MPTYVYGPPPQSPARDCPQCAERFELIQRMSEPALTACPRCGEAVIRIPVPFGLGHSVKDMLSPSNIAAKGFTQYRRNDDGTYRKTAGRGPATISKDSLGDG